MIVSYPIVIICLVFFMIRGSVTLYTSKDHPYHKYKEGDTLGDSDTLLNVMI